MQRVASPFASRPWTRYNNRPMPTVPEQLRAAREAMGLSQHQAADITKIRTDHIRALEEGNYAVFPAPVYVRGFVRSYSGLLGLNPRETVTLLDAELREAGLLEDETGRAGSRRGVLDLLMLQLSKVNWHVVLPTLVLALLAIGSILAYRGWVEYRSRDPLADLRPALYQAPVTGDILPLPESTPR